MISENGGPWKTDGKDAGRDKLWALDEKQNEAQRDDLGFFVELGKEYGFSFMTLEAFCSPRLSKVMSAIDGYIQPYSKLKKELSNGKTESFDDRKEFVAWLDWANKRDKELKNKSMDDTAEILQEYFGNFTGRMQYEGETLEVENKTFGAMPFGRFKSLSDYQSYVRIIDMDKAAKIEARNKRDAEIMAAIGLKPGEIDIFNLPKQ
ncbi:MAG: hypothetical protein LBN07_03980 [Christensenellaceae bacterium]|jgi:hypothetical protein|nr:hypothetical protein [Christensenellaceae bacterium]